MIHFCICTLGSADLLTVALASIERYAGECNVDLVKLPDDTTDPRAHGEAIDRWRLRQKIGVKDTDVVVLMDPDVILLSADWRVQMETAFASGRVGLWGAGNTAAWGPRIHASMMAIRGRVFNDLERSFLPCADLREQTWRDTGGMYCMHAQGAGWELALVQQGADWQGVSAWGTWAHLGGGTHSDVQRMTWRQRHLVPWRRREIRKRQRFLRAAHAHLKG